MKKVMSFIQGIWTQMIWWFSSRTRQYAWMMWVLDRHQMLMDTVKAAKSITELHNWMDEKNQAEPLLMPGSLVDEKGLNLRISHWGSRLMAVHFKDVLDKINAENYLEMTFGPTPTSVLDGKSDEIMVTIQRVSGKTPTQKIKELEAEVEALKQRLSQQRNWGVV